jgi:TonB family protein
MRFPFVSFSTAVLIWIFLVTVFSSAIFTKSKIPPISLMIDAAMVDEVLQKKKSTKRSSAEKLGERKIKKEIAEDVTTSDVQKKVTPLFSPLPEIPHDLRSEAFRSEAIARFHIASDGSVTNVELIKPCSNPRLNQLLLRSLRNWKFVSNSQSYVQEIRVNFEVE